MTRNDVRFLFRLAWRFFAALAFWIVVVVCALWLARRF